MTRAPTIERTLLFRAAAVEDLATIRAFVDRSSRDLGADDLCAADLVQAIDECATNVLVHGYGREAGPLQVSVERDDGSIIVALRDEARGFDPTAWPAPDLERPLAERPPGGLGIHLARASVDRMEHRPLGPTGNQLILARRTSSEEGPP